MKQLRERIALKIAPWLVRPPVVLSVYSHWVNGQPMNASANPGLTITSSPEDYWR